MIRKNFDSDWQQKQIDTFVNILPTYEKFADTLEQVLEGAAKKYAPLAIVQTRPKSIASFAEKIVRKKYTDPLTVMTDLCGGRVVTNTQNEVKTISQFIETHFEIDWENSVDISERLKPTEFGYRSVHYIVSFKPDVFPTSEIDVKIPKKLLGLKAEVQIRTLLEHAWSDVYHDTGYKGEFKIPDAIERDMAATAALLENADRNFSRIIEKLRAYKSSYGAYLEKEQIEEKIEQLELILKVDKENLAIASRIGKLAIAIENWDKAIQVLSKYKNSHHALILKDLGVALCKKHRNTPKSEQYKQGQTYLETACSLSENDVDACASLAGTWKNIDEDKARELYRQAFEMDPSDSYALSNYLEYEIAHQKNTTMVPFLRPVIEEAIQRCQAQADVGVNLPWAYYDIGTFRLLLNQPYQSIAAFAKAVQLSTASFMVETALRSLEKLAGARDDLTGFEWCRRFLLVSAATKSRTKESMDKVKELASAQTPPLEGPVVLAAGGTDAKIENQMQTYRHLLLEGVKNFKGTLLSGGTKAGVSRLIGDIGAKYSDAITTIGYIPGTIPKGVELEDTPNRYRELRTTDGSDFTPLEAAQYWIDIITSGIQPTEVKLIGINGGAISAAEYRIALALGATVGLIENSGRQADQLLQDETWKDSQNLLTLPADAVILQQFLGTSKVSLKEDMCETMAQAIHDEYRRNRSKTLAQKDPAMADWQKLADYLKESNRQQAQHIFDKLTAIGCTVREVKDRDIARMTFSDDEIEQMAELEHARWVVERLADGWQWGPERDVENKISPYLVGWAELPDEIKEWDRETVRKIPDFLADVGLEIVRQ